MTMHILLLRHGDASIHSRYDDSERPLTDTGMHQAASVGTFLQRMNVRIDAALTSPLKRAQETATIVLSHFKNRQLEISELLLNGSDPQQFFEHLQELKAPTVLLVGHEPYLSEIVSLLISGNKNIEIEMKKCSLALVEVSTPIQPGTGLLKFLIPIETIV
jgi:phosphohistidine phosphatase